ncbi:GNAT family N-acetyltransferase [Noviherbaspirillum sp.]|uniref:GNAT family N-acetyltransferase n=1 Tax=Noviherbaspirillum sp. TaxID=1926288 RepID=UPI002FE26553
MKVSLTLGDWESLKPEAQPVRYEVFVVEQNVPVELEWDDMDPVSLHAVARDEQGRALGTGRLLPDGHIGRMAVKKNARGTGIGGRILEALMEQARARGDKSVILSAQTHAAPFYSRFGFVQEGEEFMEAGIPHIQMRHEFN